MSVCPHLLQILHGDELEVLQPGDLQLVPDARVELLQLHGPEQLQQPRQVLRRIRQRRRRRGGRRRPRGGRLEQKIRLPISRLVPAGK